VFEVLLAVFEVLLAVFEVLHAVFEVLLAVSEVLLAVICTMHMRPSFTILKANIYMKRVGGPRGGYIFG
jgi:hypothetical protein